MGLGEAARYELRAQARPGNADTAFTMKQLFSAAVLGACGLAAAAAPATPASAPAPAAAATPAPRASAPNDTIEFLHQRLVERLGSVRQPTDDGTMLLRVPGRPLAAAPAPASRARKAANPEGGHAAPHWAYEGAGGPAAWARISPEFATCGNGQRQSPIDIREGIAVDLEPIQFDYRPSAFRVIDNGHTVQVNLAPGNAIQVLGRRYELLQFHFHRPSEERIAGRQFDMVAHLVHRDDQGRLAVVAVLLQRGGAQPVVQAVWNNLPLEKGEEQPAPAPLDPAGLLPEDRRYYTYMGSLTTPPCSEGVLWMVLQQPVPLAAEQIDIFARLYPMNARPLQAAGDRLIKQSR